MAHSPLAAAEAAVAGQGAGAARRPAVPAGLAAGAEAARPRGAPPQTEGRHTWLKGPASVGSLSTLNPVLSALLCDGLCLSVYFWGLEGHLVTDLCSRGFRWG